MLYSLRPTDYLIYLWIIHAKYYNGEKENCGLKHGVYNKIMLITFKHHYHMVLWWVFMWNDNKLVIEYLVIV